MGKVHAATWKGETIIKWQFSALANQHWPYNKCKLEARRVFKKW